LREEEFPNHGKIGLANRGRFGGINIFQLF
jgi:hypothetical protein